MLLLMGALVLQKIFCHRSFLSSWLDPSIHCNEVHFELPLLFEVKTMDLYTSVLFLIFCFPKNFAEEKPFIAWNHLMALKRSITASPLGL